MWRQLRRNPPHQWLLRLKPSWRLRLKATSRPMAAVGPSSGSSFDWERLLGRNWFAIIGAVALVVGICFFLKLAFDNNWIGDTGRIILGVVLGLALLGVGEYSQRRVPIWAQPVTAAGAVILYLSIYAAFGLYQLIRPDVALLFLALVVALAALLALRHESIVVALLGIIGAFLAPAPARGGPAGRPLGSGVHPGGRRRHPGDFPPSATGGGSTWSGGPAPTGFSSSGPAGSPITTPSWHRLDSAECSSS